MTDVIDKIDLFLVEAEIKKVVRKGKAVRKLICPEGFKAKDGRCVKMSPKEMFNRHKSQMIAAKKKANKGNIMAKAAKKRAKSMRKRIAKIPAEASKPNEA